MVTIRAGCFAAQDFGGGERKQGFVKEERKGDLFLPINRVFQMLSRDTK